MPARSQAGDDCSRSPGSSRREEMTSKTQVRALASAACGTLLVSLGLWVEGPRAQSPSQAIAYRPIFQDPGEDPVPDLSLEAHAIRLIDSTPPGERKIGRASCRERV